MKVSFSYDGEDYIAEQDLRGSGIESDIVVTKLTEMTREAIPKVTSQGELIDTAKYMLKRMRGKK